VRRRSGRGDQGAHREDGGAARQRGEVWGRQSGGPSWAAPPHQRHAKQAGIQVGCNDIVSASSALCIDESACVWRRRCSCRLRIFGARSQDSLLGEWRIVHIFTEGAAECKKCVWLHRNLGFKMRMRRMFVAQSTSILRWFVAAPRVCTHSCVPIRICCRNYFVDATGQKNHWGDPPDRQVLPWVRGLRR